MVKPWEMNWGNQTQEVSAKPAQQPWEKDWTAAKQAAMANDNINPKDYNGMDLVGKDGEDAKPFEKMQLFMDKLFTFEVRSGKEVEEKQKKNKNIQALEKIRQEPWNSVNWKEVGKAGARSFLEIGKGVTAHLSKIFGDWMRDERDQSLMSAREKLDVKYNNMLADSYIKLGNYIEKFWDWGLQSEWLKPDENIFKGSFVENPSLTRALSAAASGVSSIGWFGGVAKITGSRGVASALLASADADDIYFEAREKGESQNKALGLYAVGTAGTAVLEKYGFEQIFNQRVTAPLAKRVVKSMLSEGLTEGGQTLWQNLVKRIGYNDAQELMENVIESVIGGSLSGGVVSAADGGYIKLQQTREKLKAQGMSDADLDTIQEAIGEELGKHGDTVNALFQERIDGALNKFDEFIKANEGTEQARKAIQTKAELEEVYNQINDALIKDAKVNPEKANAYAKIWQGIALWGAEETGTSPLAFMEQHAPQIKKESFAQFSGQTKDVLDGDYIPFQFAGENARTADISGLDQAKSMSDVGYDSELIRGQTGWFKGPDNKWRFEISDKDATVDRQVLEDIGSIENLRAEREQLLDDIETFKKEREKNNDAYPDGYLDELISQRYDKIEKIDYDIDHGYVSNAKTTLGELLNHEKLYAAYPSLRYMPVTMRTSDDLSGGAYSRKDNTIYLDSRLSDDEIKSVLMHEIQHVIQEKENFARGGNIQFAKDYKKIIEKKASAEFMDLLDKKMKEGLERELKEYNLNKEAIVEILDAYSDYTKKFFDTDAENEEVNKAEKKYYETLEKHNISSDILENAMNNLRDQGIWKEAENEVKSKNKLSDADAYEIYKAFYGEVEARNTQKRMNMSDEERMSQSAESTQDIKNADALVVFPDGTEMVYKNIYNPDKVSVKNGIVDLTNAFEKSPKPKDVRNYLKEVLKFGNEFLPLSKDWIIDVKNNAKKRSHISIPNHWNNMSDSQKREHNKYAMAFKYLIENAEYVSSQNNKKTEEKQDIAKYHYFKTTVKIGDHIFDVILDTEQNVGEKEDKPQTVHLYNLEDESVKRASLERNTKTSSKDSISQNGENVNSEKVQFQGGENTTRKVAPRGAYVDRVLYLFENADASTFMHETAHWFFEELANLNTAKTNEMRAKIDEWANNEFDKRYKVIEIDNGFAVADKTGNIVYGEDQAFDALEQARDYAKNELFARGFEQYLRDGKAPNNYLKEAFRSFLNWLRRLYKAATELNVDLNDDIRNVFGQILGGDNLDFYLEAPVDEILQHNFEMNKDRQKANDDIISDALNNMSADTYSDVWKYELHDLKKAAQSTKRIYKEKREMVKKAGGDLIDKIITPIDTRLNRINPKLKNRMVNYEARLGIKLNNYYRQIKPFMDIWKTFSRADLTAFDLALKNGYMQKQLEIVNKYNAYNEFVAVKNVLANIFDNATQAGIELGYLPDYFPRAVKDANAFLQYLEGDAAFSPLRRQLDAWIEEQRENNLEPTPEEKIEFINRYMMGFRRNESIRPLPGNTKDRMIDIIDKDMNKFYKPSMDALISYIEGMNAAIEQRKLFGRDAKNIANTIGAWVDELMANQEITPEQDEEVRQIFAARFSQRGVSNKYIAFARDASYIYTMGGINSAITQFDDIFMSIYENGLFESGKELFADNIEGLSRQDLGLESIGQEYSEKSLTSELVNKTFKLTGLDKIDSLMKTKYTNATFKKFQKMAKEDPEALRERIEPIMEELTPKVMEDLREGRITEDVQVLMFNALSEFQPISLSQMPEGYLRSGNLRVLYMLKTFTLKRIDTFRRKCLDEYRKGNKKQALQNLFRLSLIMMLCGMAKDALIDMLYGRPFNISDMVVNNILGLVGLSKFQLYKLRDDGVDGFLFSLTVPPVKPLYTDLLRDLPRVWNGKKELKDLEAFKGIPLIGRFYYWWLGGGRAKIEKQKNKGKKKLK